MDEIIVGDLLRSGMSIKDVWGLGYFEAWRIWSIIDEIRMRDLEHLYRVLDASNANDEYRNSVTNWLRSRQPRAHPPVSIPEDVLKRLEAAFNG